MAETLKAARDAKGLTRKALAELTGLNDQYIYQLEAGIRRPTLESLWVLAGALDLDPHSLDERLAPRRKRGR